MPTVGIVGTGWGARVQVPAFREAGLDVMGPAGRRDWRELVRHPKVDIVSVVMPPPSHLEIATAALEAGKHVISEKPTAMNEREARQLLAAAKGKASRIAIIDHELRFLPSFITARQRIADIGALRFVEIRYASPARGDRTRAWNWWSDEAQGGGVWGAVGSHFVDSLRYFGFEIDAVQALMHTVVRERPSDDGPKRVTSDDVTAVHLRLRGGAIAIVALSAVASGPEEAATMTLHGESGAFRLTGEELLQSQPGKPFVRIAGGELQQRPGNSPGGAFGTGTLLLGRALKSALDGDRNALAAAATFAEGLAQQRVLDAARRSAKNDGRWERVTTSEE